MKKNRHGGKRKGAGRPKLKDSEKKEPTKVMRVPISKLKEVQKILNSETTITKRQMQEREDQSEAREEYD